MTGERKYREEVHQVSCRDKTVTIRNLIPVYTAQERKKVKAGINQTLYGVFSKYR
jgi:hypothetical protein